MFMYEYACIHFIYIYINIIDIFKEIKHFSSLKSFIFNLYQFSYY